MMTVWLSGVVFPKSIGSRKYIQKITIKSGRPRTALMKSTEGQRIQACLEMLRSPSIRPPKTERMQETTAR